MFSTTNFPLPADQALSSWVSNTDVSPLPSPGKDQELELAKEILKTIMNHRRAIDLPPECAHEPCTACKEPHLPKIIRSIEAQRPIPLVLPAFPGKSPNLAKVLGVLPDMAEQKALEFLEQLCQRIKKIYSPGAKVILCSDGRVFSDLIGQQEQDISNYKKELKQMTHELQLNSISTFDLDEVYEGKSYPEMRSNLMANHGSSVEKLRAKVLNGSNAACSTQEEREAHRMYCGITRFLVEDASHPGQTKSRTAIQKECRARAYQVILRSNAWSNLIQERFPSAVRLSIHPQGCGSAKLGIRLLEPDNWMTPWHGVALDLGDRFILVKRIVAEQLGAILVHREGRPSHFAVSRESLPTNTGEFIYGN